MRRRTCRLLAAVATLTGTVLLFTGGAGAAAPDDVGWWYKLRQAAIGEILNQRPPNVPEGGLYVAQDPTGAAAVSALRYEASSLESGVLRLAVADGSTALGAEIVACPTFSGWTPEEGGRWSDRPRAECDVLSIGGSVDTTGNFVTWTFPSTLADGDLLNIMLVPADGATPFQVAFAPPGEDSLVASLLPEEEPTTTTTAPPAFTQPPSGFGSGGVTFEPPPTFNEPALDFSAPPPVQSETTATTVATREVQEAAAPRLPVPESRTARIVAVGILFALGALLYWMGNQPTRAPRLLGAVAAARGGAVALAPAPAVGGIGRFARPRSAPPDRLA